MKTLAEVVKEYSEKHTVAFQIMKAAEAIQNIDKKHRVDFCKFMVEVCNNDEGVR